MNSGSLSHDNHRRVAVAIAIKVKGQAHLAVISDLGMNVQNSSVLLAGDRPTFPLENNVWIDAKFWDINLSFLLNPDPFEFSLQTWTCDWFTCWQNCAHLTSVVCRCLCPWFYILSRFYFFFTPRFLRAPTFPEPCSPPGLQTNFRLVTDLTRDNKTADSVTTKGWRSTWCTPVSSPLLWESQQQQHMLQRRLTMAPPQTHVDKTETSLCFPVFSHSNITIAEQRSHWVLCEDGREGEGGRGGVSASLFSLISVGTSGSIVCIYFILAKLNQGNLSQ